MPEGQEPQEPTGPEPDGNDPKDATNDSGQEPKTFDADYVKKLRDEAAGWRTKAQEAQSKVAEFQDRDKTEQQKLEERAAKAESQAQDANSKLLRYEVAAEKNLPPKWAARLRGNTKEELAADAEELAKEIQPPSDFDGGARGRADTGQDDMNVRIRRAAGRA